MNIKITEMYRRYVLGLLFVIYTLNFLDRQLMSILLEPIKLEFHLTDTDMGILTGIAFALLYSSLGFPMARWTDRGDRVSIISLSLFIWSFFTTITGFATGYWQLFLTRVGVGIGEAGCSPASYSLISDYFAKEHRGKAISIYSLGIPFGVFCGFIIGGVVAQQYGWRAAFYTAGIPGIILAYITKKTLISLPRGHADNTIDNSEPRSVYTQFKYYFKNRAFMLMSFGAGLQSALSYGLGAFLASFMIRSHGLTIAEAGFYLAFLYIFGAGIGMYLSGSLADRLSSTSGRTEWYLWIPAITALLTIPIGVGLVYFDTINFTLTFVFLLNFIGVMYWGPVAAFSQRLAKVNERAMATAILFFINNIIGLGLGPFVVGLLSSIYNDWLLDLGMDSALASAEGLRYAILSVMPISLIGSLLFYLASGSAKKSTEVS